MYFERLTALKNRCNILFEATFNSIKKKELDFVSTK